MRLGILIRDVEYRHALVDKLSSYDNNIFVNILDDSTKDSSGCLILTDIQPHEIDGKVLDAIRHRIVFLTESSGGIPDGCHAAFKYGSVTSLISEISLAYNEWHGSGPGRNYPARIISVICENDAYSSEKCSQLARQIIYRKGGRVLILPLSYINDYGLADNGGNTLSRLLYSLRTGHERSSDSFTFSDSYGVSALILPPGRNPIAYIDENELRSLIHGLATQFDTMICDIGTCLRNENMSLIQESDHAVFFEIGRRSIGLRECLGTDSPKKLISIKLTGGSDEALAIDDCVKQIFSSDNDGNYENCNNKKIRA